MEHRRSKADILQLTAIKVVGQRSSVKDTQTLGK